jgi:hypothetical protein
MSMAESKPPSTKNTKAFLLTERGTNIPCLFNPSQFSFSRSNSWSATSGAGKGVTLLKYKGASSGTLNLTLFFDTTDTGQPVTTYTQKLSDLMEIDPQLAGSNPASNNGRPEWLTFHWGRFHSFKAVVTSLTLAFDYFSFTGVPLRATANMTLTQYDADKVFGPQNPTSGTPRPHRVHRVQRGETLDRIAALHLGDSTRWRSIAETNDIEDPLALRPGSLLAIPYLF